MRLIHYYLYNLRIHILRKFKLKRQYKKIGLISTNLETYGYCNRKCDFCFNSNRFKQREKGIMPVATWEKIIDELSEMKFCGRISPHFYGEPLLDKRLPKLIMYARRKCPNAYILIVSNGDYLNEELFKILIKNGVNQFSVTNYDDVEKTYLKMLVKKYPAHIIVKNYRDFHKTDRAGEIFDKRITLNISCLRPSAQLVVNWKGEVLLCCMDYYARCKFGNVNVQTISEIWNSKNFKRYRVKLQKGKREKISICKYCDDSGKIPW
ncbi:MAG: SPASM domain-containing protein [Candidatus Cloacimonetes bacterium]|nr:SPASM domain-containing protein [Candidatus Cloacimonadota bacterium]MBL7086574.1 SPASM domain-containing protein [Candidatus Cloacimonadota bacterium]